MGATLPCLGRGASFQTETCCRQYLLTRQQTGLTYSLLKPTHIAASLKERAPTEVCPFTDTSIPPSLPT